MFSSVRLRRCLSCCHGIHEKFVMAGVLATCVLVGLLIVMARYSPTEYTLRSSGISTSFWTRIDFVSSTSRSETNVVGKQNGTGLFAILFWNSFFDRADFYAGYGRQPFLGCHFNNCLTTTDREQFRHADAVVVHMSSPFDQLPVAERKPWQRYVFFLMESPTNTKINLTPYDAVFNITMTYHRRSDVRVPYFQLLPGPDHYRLPDLSTKQLPVAWIVSNCHARNDRQIKATELARHIRLDIFGACGTLTCPAKGRECYHLLAPTYYFYLAMENSNCEDYITEKLSYPLIYGMVPIVYGPSRANYEQLAPPGSFIHFDDFDSVEELAAHLRDLMARPDRYRKYFEWRSSYRVVDAMSSSWCDLCSYLNNIGSDHVVHSNVSGWWKSTCAADSNSTLPS